nr:MAG TPA: leucine-rich repeat protein [Bacteriophage sp.]
MADIVLYDRTGSAVTYSGVDTITTDTPIDGETATFTYGKVVDGTEIDLALADGDQTVSVPAGSLVREATIKKPETMTPEHIKKGVNVAGVVGTFAGDEMEKTVDLNMADGDQIVDADPDTVMTKVTVRKPETLVPENIADGVEIGGVVGTKTAMSPGFLDGTTPFELTDAYFTTPPKTISVSYFCSSNQALTKVNLSQVTFLPYYTFNHCSNLKEVLLSRCLSMSAYVFSNCINLQNIYLPECQSIGASAFNRATITSLSLPKCERMDSAFRSCYNLESVYMPNIKHIQVGAFSNCSKILEILQGVSYFSDICFGGYSFVGFSSTVQLRENTRIIAAEAFYQKALYSIQNTESIEYIGSAAFYSTRIQNASFPKCIELTGQSTFMVCSSLLTAYLPLVTSIPYNTFCQCKSVSSIYIPNVESVAGYGFNQCYLLEKLNIPKCKTANADAFANCSKMSFINIKNLEVVNGRTFWMCSALQEIYIPKCSSIGISAFLGCSSLSTVVLGDCTIYSNAFSSTWMLNSLYLIGSSICDLKSGGYYTFYSSPIWNYSAKLGKYGSVFVRESLLASYKQAYLWSNMSNRIFGISDEEIETLKAEMEAKYETANSDTAV